MGTQNEQATLVVDGEEFNDWQRYEIESDMLQPADAFSFTAANDDAQMAGKINKGDRFKLLMDGELQMVGHVDDVVYVTDRQGSRVDIRGRDDFSALVDCSAPLISRNNQTLLMLARELTEDWIENWELQSGVGITYISKIKIEPGEKILDVLQRFAAKDKVLIWMTAGGKGHIGRPNYSQAVAHAIRLYKQTNPRAALYNNVIRSSVTQSWRNQYSSISVYGTTGNTAAKYGRGAHSKTTSTEASITSARPLIITDGDIRDIKDAKARADLEVARRLMEATRAEYTVKGFYGQPPEAGAESVLYQQDHLVDVEDERSGVKAVYFTTRRRFTHDENGKHTTLGLFPAGVWMT